MPNDELIDFDFEIRFAHICDVDSLKENILKRYKSSLAHLSDDEKLALSVSITELDIPEKSSVNINSLV